MQLKFEGMLEEIDKELTERANSIIIEHIENCDGNCAINKKEKDYTNVKTVTEIADYLIDYFKKYSPDSVWGQWLQNYFHVKVSLTA